MLLLFLLKFASFCFRFLEPDFEPRTTLIYNNLFFTLLGHVTEELVGTPWELLIQRDIYDSVKLSNHTLTMYFLIIL